MHATQAAPGSTWPSSPLSAPGGAIIHLYCEHHQCAHRHAHVACWRHAPPLNPTLRACLSFTTTALRLSRCPWSLWSPPWLGTFTQTTDSNLERHKHNSKRTLTCGCPGCPRCAAQCRAPAQRLCRLWSQCLQDTHTHHRRGREGRVHTTHTVSVQPNSSPARPRSGRALPVSQGTTASASVATKQPDQAWHQQTGLVAQQRLTALALQPALLAAKEITRHTVAVAPAAHAHPRC